MSKCLPNKRRRLVVASHNDDNTFARIIVLLAETQVLGVRELGRLQRVSKRLQQVCHEQAIVSAVCRVEWPAFEKINPTHHSWLFRKLSKRLLSPLPMSDWESCDNPINLTEQAVLIVNVYDDSTNCAVVSRLFLESDDDDGYSLTKFLDSSGRLTFPLAEAISLGEVFVNETGIFEFRDGMPRFSFLVEAFSLVDRKSRGFTASLSGDLVDLEMAQTNNACLLDDIVVLNETVDLDTVQNRGSIFCYQRNLPLLDAFRAKASRHIEGFRQLDSSIGVTKIRMPYKSPRELGLNMSLDRFRVEFDFRQLILFGDLPNIAAGAFIDSLWSDGTSDPDLVGFFEQSDEQRALLSHPPCALVDEICVNIFYDAPGREQKVFGNSIGGIVPREVFENMSLTPE